MRLERGYSELLVMSNKRLSDLESLLDYIQTATAELMWLNEKEDMEVSRDWSAKNLKIVDIEQYREVCAQFRNFLLPPKITFDSSRTLFAATH